ncbi:hypothetical protein A0257_22165 [Hymenobacter psoromatis]|nr:hypothetical protein A0257_22165 [Hymenobacter psoromatis]
MNKLVPLRRFTARWGVGLLLAALTLGAGACQQAKPDAATAAKPGQAAYYTCPMHPQIHAEEPGSCPICHMDLIAVAPTPVAAAAAAQPAAAVGYTCPMHPQIHAHAPGSCPICGMDLVKTSARPTINKLPDSDLSTNDLILTAQQLELGNIQVRTLRPESTPQAEALPRADAPPQMVLTGTVTADAQRTESISSRVAGRLDKLYVRQTGERLRQGAPLFSVYSEQLQTLQREYLLALAEDLQVAGPTYRHLAEATAQKLRLLGVSAAQLRELVRRGRPSPLVTYYSPRVGTVQTLAVTQGQYVAEGSPVLTLTDLSRVWVEAQLYPAEAGRLSLGQTVAVQAAGQARPVRGQVVFLSPELSGESQLTLARIAVANPDGRLQPGAQANVLLTGSATPAARSAASTAATGLPVPPAAVIHDGANSYVWKQTGERQFRRVRVRLGAGTAFAVPALSGVRPGDRLVVAGAYLLESEFTLRRGAGDDHMSGMAM